MQRGPWTRPPAGGAEKGPEPSAAGRPAAAGPGGAGLARDRASAAPPGTHTPVRHVTDEAPHRAASRGLGDWPGPSM